MKAEDVAKLNIKVCQTCGSRLRGNEKLKCTACEKFQSAATESK